MSLLAHFKAKVPSALELAVLEFESTLRMRLEHSSKREYHAAIEVMLAKRAERLRKEILELSKEGEEA